MAALKPFALYGLTVPAGDIAIEADGNVPYPATFRVTMAAIDPDAELESDMPKRATLKLIKIRAPEFESDDDDDDFDDDDVAAIERRLGLTSEDDDDDDEESDDEKNGGPSDPEKSKKARAEALIKALKDDEEMDDLELTNGVNGTKSSKGKAKAVEDEIGDDDDDDDEEEDSEDEDIKEYVVCTLDPEKNCQQPLDITLNNENEICYFKSTGPYKIYLTGNFCIPPDIDSEEEEDEDSDDDELALLPEGLEDMSDSEEEDDELDDLDDPRITELDDEEKAPKLIKVAETIKKGKNKRRAEEEESENDEDEDVDMADEDILKKILKAPAPETKLSKKQKKKLKNNAGEAVPATAGAEKDKKPAAKEDKTKEPANKDSPTNGKKVQFAKNLEQGPTPTKASNQAKPGTRNVEGVTIDDRKAGQGRQAKKGDRVELRYIGKLQDGKVFDANKKGKPFGFKLGDGSVIKGWDIGIQGMAVGGERRITIPAKLAYGNKSMPGIPANSELIFDLKLISIK